VEVQLVKQETINEEVFSLKTETCHGTQYVNQSSSKYVSIVSTQFGLSKSNLKETFQKCVSL